MAAANVVEFDYDTWAILYSELSSSVTKELAKAFFIKAGIYCDNTPCSPIQDLDYRSQCLMMMVSHLIKLNVKINGEEPSPLVGRISQATEGTVSVTVTNDYPPGTVQWYQSTKYGAEFWVATSQFRQGFYEPGPAYVSDPYAPLGLQ